MKKKKKVGLDALDLGRPVQLISVTGQQRLELNKDSFLWNDVSEYPVVLLSVIGEKRKGKSFLMNYIMRALDSQEKIKDLCLGEKDEPLVGFEWRMGTDSTTKGIWIWNRPFLLEQNGKKIAVYVMDTEGSLDVGTNRKTNIKLSALSKLLSSHLVFNVSCQLKETELDFLEDILIRDWQDHTKCSEEDAESYIRKLIEKLQDNGLYPNTLSVLKDRHIRCFLLPLPGKKITGTSQGKLADMDEDFLECFRKYIYYVVEGAWKHIKTDKNGELKAKDLLSSFQKSVDELNRVTCDFSSPLQMHFALENQKHRERILNEFDDYLKSLWAWRAPSVMKSLLSDEYHKLCAKFNRSITGSNSEHPAMIADFKSQMKLKMEKFLYEYSRRFYMKLGMAAATGACGVAFAAAAPAPSVMSELWPQIVPFLETTAVGLIKKVLTLKP